MNRGLSTVTVVMRTRRIHCLSCEFESRWYVYVYVSLCFQHPALPVLRKTISQFLIFVVPCIMLNSEINPTRCSNCVYSSQRLYSTCFGWQFHPSSGVHMVYMASGRQVYCKLTKSVITIIFDTTSNMQSQVFYHTNPIYYPDDGWNCHPKHVE